MSDLLNGVSGVDLASSVSVAVAKKSLDAAKMQGAAAVSMIKSAGKVGQDAPAPRPMPGEPGSRLDSNG